LAEWRPLADTGDAAAEFYLGLLYENGLGVVADDRAAVNWYRRAAEQDHREAAKRLALINFAGRHMWTSKLQAVKWFRRAAELGDAESQGFTGLIFREGWGVAPDPVEALKWFILAAGRGHAKAAEDRDALARSMPADGVAAAKQRAAAWRTAHR
jgi:TPR repeat protein